MTSIASSVELNDYSNIPRKRQQEIGSDRLALTGTATDHTKLYNNRAIPRSPSRRLEIRKSFRFAKSSPLLLGAHLLVLPTGGTAPISSPSYHTSSLLWCHGYYMPPSFTAHLGAANFKDTRDNFACVKYVNWEGCWGLHFVIQLASGGKGLLEDRARVRRVGGGRTYYIQSLDPRGERTNLIDGLRWEGRSRTAINALEIASDDYINGMFSASSRGGHSLLYHKDSPARPLAVWANTTAIHYLGDLLLLEDFEEGNGLEEVVMGAIGIVLAERVSGRGFWGSMNFCS